VAPYLEYSRWRKFSLNSVVECVDFKLSGKLFHNILPLYVINLFPN